MCELILSRLEPARRFRLSPAPCLLLCLLSLLTAARCSAPNMELESDRVPIETPFQSSHHSYQESNDKILEQDHLVSDSTYPGRGNPLTSSSMEQVDESHYHGYETLPIKSSEVNVASQTSLDSKNSLQNDVTVSDKNSNRKLQDDDVIQSPSHEASSEKVAPDGNLNHGGVERKGEGDGGVEGEESSFANRLDKSFEKGVGGEASVQQGPEQDAFADKIDEKQPTPHADDVGLSEGIAETRQENGDNSESPSLMKEGTGVDKNVHEEGEERDVVDKGKPEDDKMTDMEKQEDSSKVEEVQTESSEKKEEDKEELSSRMPEEEVGVVSEGGGELGGVSRKEGAGHSELDEVDESSDDDMMTFEEFKQKKMEEAQQSGPRQVEDQPPPVGVVNVKSKNNYASVDCGAKVIRHNPEAKNTQDILKENKDAYMINPCSAKIWFVVELCELVSVRTLEIASFELFSSTPESFNVYASERFEENVQVDWVHLGKFHAVDERRAQQFPLDTYVYAKYIKVDMLSHYGNEHYCPLSLLRVLGASMMDIYEESQQQKEKPPPTASSVVLPDDDLEYDEEEGEMEKVNKTLLRRAREVVLSMLKHPLRLVNDFINKETDEEGNEEQIEVKNRSHDINNKSHDHPTVDTPPLPTTPPSDTSSDRDNSVKSDGEAGEACDSDSVKVTEDFDEVFATSSYSPPGRTSGQDRQNDGGSDKSTDDEDSNITTDTEEVSNTADVGGDEESAAQRDGRPTDIKGDTIQDSGLPSQNLESPVTTPTTTPPPSTLSQSDNITSSSNDQNSAESVIEGLPPTHSGAGGGGTVSLGPTNGKGGSSDSDDVSAWNTGGAISSKDKAPIGNDGGQRSMPHPQTTGEGERGEVKGDVIFNREDEKSDNLIEQNADYAENGGTITGDISNKNGRDERVREEKSHDKSDHTSLPLGPPVIETSSKDKSIDKEEHPSGNHGNHVPSQVDKNIGTSESNGMDDTLPTDSQINKHETSIGSTNNDSGSSHATPAVPNEHVASAGVSMATNEGNIASGFDGEDLGNGVQERTAVDKEAESILQVPAKDRTNDSTDDVRLDNVLDTSLPSVSNKDVADDSQDSTPGASVDADGRGDTDGKSTLEQQSEQMEAQKLGKVISPETDSSSSEPAVGNGQLPRGGIQSYEEDEEKGEGGKEGEESSFGTGVTTAIDTTSERSSDDVKSGDREMDDSEGAEEKTEREGDPTTMAEDAVKSLPGDKRESVENFSPGLDLGLHSVNGPLSSDETAAIRSIDEISAKNNVQGSQAASVNESHDNDGMQSNELKSHDDEESVTSAAMVTPTMTSSLHNGKGHDNDAHNNPTNGISGMSDNDMVESHTHQSASDEKEGGASSRKVVTNGLPNTTKNNSTNVSNANDNPPSNHNGPAQSSTPSPGQSSTPPTSVGSEEDNSGSLPLRDIQPPSDGSFPPENDNQGAAEEDSSHASLKEEEKNISATGQGSTVAPLQGGMGSNATQNLTIPPLSAGGNGNSGVGGGHGSAGVGSQLMQGRDREKSVFLRLSNQIQELEMNMSLFSSYLDQISTSLKRNRNRTDETTKAQDKKISSLNESLVAIAQAIHEMTSKEVDVLLQVHLELQSERDQLLNVSKRVDAIPDDIYSTHFWLVLAQFAVIVLVLLVCCVWLCHIKCVLERKLNTIQRTLSSLQNPPILKNSSLDGTRDVKLVKSGMENGDDSDLGTKLCERTKSTSPTHSRSFSLTSVSDLSRKTENIGDLSRPEINSLSSQKSRGYREELLRPRSATGLASGGALSSYSLSSLDDRKQTEVFSGCEGRKKKKHKTKKATG